MWAFCSILIRERDSVHVINGFTTYMLSNVFVFLTSKHIAGELTYESLWKKVTG